MWLTVLRVLYRLLHRTVTIGITYWRRLEIYRSGQITLQVLGALWADSHAPSEREDAPDRSIGGEIRISYDNVFIQMLISWFYSELIFFTMVAISFAAARVSLVFIAIYQSTGFMVCFLFYSFKEKVYLLGRWISEGILESLCSYFFFTSSSSSSVNIMNGSIGSKREDWFPKSAP